MAFPQMTAPASLLALVFVLGLSSCLAVQLAQQQVQRPSLLLELASSRGQPQTCTALKNQGTYSTVKLGVGTPPQFLDVVADTGSDSVVVTSCLCQESGGCSPKGSCFRGEGKSSTFKLVTMSESQAKAAAAAGAEGGGDNDSKIAAGLSEGNMGEGSLIAGHPSSGKASNSSGQLEVVSLMYGSGPITAVLATDVVKVGAVQATMPGGVLLMVQQQLNIEDGSFEGILGLGLPQAAPKETDVNPLAVPMPPGFLEQAAVSRFSICFNYETDGVLRLGVPASKAALGSVGQAHWGLDFRGISVGGDDVRRALFCSEQDLPHGQKTPCGAIPDSGTTVMMGPTDQVQSLFEGLCTEWPRCKSLAVGSASKDKAALFQALLYNCSSWLGEQGLNELPDLFFHVAGAEGNMQSLKMSGYGYVIQSEQPQVKEVTKYLMGVFPVTVDEPTGKEISVCTPAFGTMEYNTKDNGPVWILGTPLFYDFQVVYDLKASPPTVAFDSTPCGSCAEADDKPSLLAESNRGRQPRRVSGPLRVNHFDTSKPL